MSLSLVKGGKPRRLSNVEMEALVAERVSAWKLGRERARAAWESERNYAERVAFYRTDFKRRQFWTAVTCISALVVTAGLAWIFSTEALAALGLTLSIGLMAVATWLSTRGQ